MNQDATFSDVNNAESEAMSNPSNDNTNTLESNQRNNLNDDTPQRDQNFDRKNPQDKVQNKNESVPYQRFQEVNKKVQDYKKKTEELEKKLSVLSFQDKAQQQSTTPPAPVTQKSEGNNFDLDKEVSNLLTDITKPNLKDKYENYQDLAMDLRKDLINTLVQINQRDITKQIQQEQQIRQTRNQQVSQIKQILGNDQAKLDEFVDYANQFLSTQPKGGLFTDLRDVFMNYSQRFLTSAQTQQAKSIGNNNSTSAISKSKTPANNQPKVPLLRDIRSRSFDQLKEFGRNAN